MKQPHYWRNLLLFGLGALAVGAIIGGVYLVWVWTVAHVHPRRLSITQIGAPADYGIPYQDIELTTADGIKLSAWYTPPQNGVVILVAHGHAAIRLIERHVLFAKNGYGVISWDFRAHGESGGETCTFGYYEALDVTAALDYALAQAEVKRVGAWGGSMGGAAVVFAAGQRPEIEAVVIDSTFPTLEDQMNIKIPLAVLYPFVHAFGEFETGIRVADVRPVERIGALSPRPVMIIQGLADSTLPPDTGQRLYNAAGEPRFLWTEPDVGHLAMYNALPQAYENRVIGFFDNALAVIPAGDE
jgi:fermentation-respiration switch protein FrsA (DUF1100 family)